MEEAIVKSIQPIFDFILGILYFFQNIVGWIGHIGQAIASVAIWISTFAIKCLNIGALEVIYQAQKADLTFLNTDPFAQGNAFLGKMPFFVIFAQVAVALIYFAILYRIFIKWIHKRS